MQELKPLLNRVFKIDGLLAAQLGGSYEIRTSQEAMSHAVLQAMHTGGQLIAEAGTGVGKSFAYLLPASLWACIYKRRVLVCTDTRTLQQQLFRKDLPNVAAILAQMGFGLRFALLMGGENYVCHQRLDKARRQSRKLFGDENTDSVLERLNTMTSLEWSGRKQDLGRMGVKVLPEVWDQVSWLPDVCVEGSRFYKHSCYRRLARLQAEKAHIVVVNHALFFANVATQRHLLPEFHAIIFDEAHSLEDAALKFGAVGASNVGLSRLLGEIGNPEKKTGLVYRSDRHGQAWQEATLQAAASVRNEGTTFFESVHEFLVDGSNPGTQVRGHLPEQSVPLARRITERLDLKYTLGPPLRTLVHQLRAARQMSRTDVEEKEVISFENRFVKFDQTARTVLEATDPRLACWAESKMVRKRRQVSLEASPFEAAAIFKESLGDVPIPVIFTSATLSYKGSFDVFQRRLGICSAQSTIYASPFDYSGQALLYAPQLPPPDKSNFAAYRAAVERECVQLLEASKGGAFILLTSFEHLRSLKESLQRYEQLADLRFFEQRADYDSYALLDAFRRTRNGVLLGTDSFWQGADVPGPALRLVIVPKLPFEVPNTPLAEAMYEHVRKDLGRNPFWEVSVPNAIQFFLQGCGRLIRSRSDHGVIAVLDSRIHTKSYGPAFLASLPRGIPRASGIEDIRGFFRTHFPYDCETPSRGH